MGYRRSPLLKRTRWCAAFGCTNEGLKTPRVANLTPNFRDQDVCKVADTRKLSKFFISDCWNHPKTTPLSTRSNLLGVGSVVLVEGIAGWIPDRGDNLIQGSQAGFHIDIRVAQVDDVGRTLLSVLSCSHQRILGRILKSVCAHQSLS